MGHEFNSDLGSMSPGETRTVRMIVTASTGGTQSIRANVQGSGGLSATTEGSMHVTQCDLQTVLDGPGLRYLDRQAVYTIRMTNPGDAPADNVKAMVSVPTGFKVIACSTGGRFDAATSSLSWIVGSIAPSETKEVSYKCQATQAGGQKHSATVTAARGIKRESELVTQVEGISALLLEVVDIDDPVEVGADTAYEIRVTNQGSREATNVTIHALVPSELTIRGAQGPTKYRVESQEVLFDPIAKLPPRADAVYRIQVTGVAKGDVRFRARLTSDSLTEPVIEEESTKVYGD
jgi:uncharacterized repeat protein (TIGR01451 family)